MTPAIETDSNNGQGARIHRRELAIGMLAGPILWFVQIFVGYALTPLACQSNSKLSLGVLAAVTGVLTLIAGIVAWRQWQLATNRRFLDLDDPQVPPSFLGSMGVAVSLLFLFIILATGIANVVLSPCPLLTMTAP